MSVSDKVANIYTLPIQKKILNFLNGTRYPKRNRVIFLLSCKAGLRAKEIALLEWRHVLNDDSTDIGDAIRISDKNSKGKSGGRIIFLADELRESLQDHYHSINPTPRREDRIIVNQQGIGMNGNGVAKIFLHWFKEMKLEGYSSHSGRRTFITQCARKISMAGGTLLQVQKLAGHSDFKTTKLYIIEDEEAMRKVVNMI